MAGAFYEFRPLYDIKVPISAIHPAKVPMIAKQYAEEFINSNRPYVVVQKIYEETLSIDVGAVVMCLYPSRYDEYVGLMQQEDSYHMTKHLQQNGDGVLLK